jgi:hypothetical protein
MTDKWLVVQLIAAGVQNKKHEKPRCLLSRHACEPEYILCLVMAQLLLVCSVRCGPAFGLFLGKLR